MQPDCRPDEAGGKKHVGGCREYFHFIAVNLRLGLARKDSMATRTSLSKIVQRIAVSERSILYLSFYRELGFLLSARRCF